MMIFLWILGILASLYFYGAVRYTLHTIKRVKRGGVRIIGVRGWLITFFLWPLAAMMESALDHMLM